MNENNEKEQAAVRRTELLAVVVDLGMKLITARLMAILALFLDAGMFAWALSSESWLRLAGASIFAIASWCIINLQKPGSTP